MLKYTLEFIQEGVFPVIRKKPCSHACMGYLKVDGLEIPKIKNHSWLVCEDEILGFHSARFLRQGLPGYGFLRSLCYLL